MSTLLGGRHKQKQLCHTNILKKHIDRGSSVISSVNLANSVPQEQNQIDSEEMHFVKSDSSSSKLQNSDILKDLDRKLSHLDSDERLGLKRLILEYEHLLPDIPPRTDKIYHDVDNIDGSIPVKQHPYRMNPAKQQYLREEVQYLLDKHFIVLSKSECSSCIFLYQNLMEHFVCVRITIKQSLSPKRTHFPSHESMTALIALDIPNMLQNSI